MSETKAMSQESEVTKLDGFPIGHWIALLANDDPTSQSYRDAVAAIEAWRTTRRAPPADARLREAVIEECAKKIRNDLLWAAPELWESKIARRIADALPHLDGRPISAEARDIIIEECASAIEDAFRSAPNDRASGYRQNTISHGCIEAARVVRALRSSPAPLSPSKGARETPALDEVLGNVHRSSQAGFTELRNRARAELSALKSAAQERDAALGSANEAALIAEASVLRSALLSVRPKVEKYCPSGLAIIDRAMQSPPATGEKL